MFKLPFVSRARYDLLEHNAQQLRDMAHRAHEQAQTYRALFEAATLRADRFADRMANMPSGGRMEPVARPATASDEAIDQKVREFGNSTRLRRLLQDVQRKGRQMRMEEDAIADQILNWRDPDSDEAVT